MKRVLVLGSTGSIGRNTLAVLSELGETHRVVGLTAHTHAARLSEQAQAFRPEAVGLDLPEAAAAARDRLAGTGIEVFEGPTIHEDLVDRLAPDMVVLSVTGAAGLRPSLRAAEQGCRLALANKESLVMAGHLLVAAAERSGAEVIPVDSEHSAVFQALRGEGRAALDRIVLTASGGPFIDRPVETLYAVTPEEALNHPTWKMGPKITVDSATMMNKALEIVEARWLFSLPPERIEVRIHRQSIVHGMAAFMDGSVIAQLGAPDMKVPIRFALTFPERRPATEGAFDFDTLERLTFEAPDFSRFPALELGYRAARDLGLAGTVLNAADETAVDLFLRGTLTFDAIPTCVARVMDAMKNRNDPSLEEIFAADRWAREETKKCFSQS